MDGWSGSGSPTWDNAPQRKVLMAYKSPGLIFYSAEKRLPGEHIRPIRMQKHRYVCVFVLVPECSLNTHSILRYVNSRKHFRIVFRSPLGSQVYKPLMCLCIACIVP